MAIFDELERSLIVITGAKGVGKTIMAYTVAPPSRVNRVFVHDAENSGNRFVQQLKAKGREFGHYLNLDDKWTQALPNDKDLLARIMRDDLPWVSRGERDSMVDYYRAVLEDIDKNLEPNKFDVYIHDTNQRFEAGMAAFVEANRDKTGWKRKAYGEMWWKGVYPLYRAFLNALYQRGVKVVIFTTHLHTPWVDNKPVVGAVEPRGKSVLYQLSQLHIWLVNDARNANGEPAGLVFKERLGNVGIDTENDTWDIKKCLPPRIPTCTWKNIEGYLKNGLDMSHLTEREQLSSSEQRMLSTTLDDMQMQLMILQTQKELLDKKAETLPVLGEPDPAQMARKLYDEGNGLAIPAIAEQLGKPLPLVQRWVNA